MPYLRSCHQDKTERLAWRSSGQVIRIVRLGTHSNVRRERNICNTIYRVPVAFKTQDI